MLYAIFKIDGTISIMQLVSNESTIENEISKLNINDQAAIINIVEIKQDAIPSTREFRNAWTLDNDKIVHDLAKAKNIQLEHLRAKRDELLKQYDGLQLRAMDLSDTEEINRIRNIKQQLRDATDALKNLTPANILDIKNATPDLGVFKI